MTNRAPRATALLLVAASLGACSDAEPELLAPASTNASLLGEGVAATVGRRSSTYLVVFRGEEGIPADFAAQVEAAGASLNASLAPVGVALVDGLNPRAAADIANRRDVRFVEPDQTFDMKMEASTPEPEYALAPTSAADPATAAGFARQWNMRAIEADQAWSAGHLGSADVTIAILDTGIDYMLPDLQGRVDLARSVSFVPEDDFYLGLIFGPSWHPIADLDGHGTNVASQTTSNALYYAGVTSRSTLMGVKICSFLGGCSFSATALGIQHAVDNGADVINMSLGGSFAKRSCQGCTAVIKRLLDYAWDAGVTVVVSAGNSAADLDHDRDGYKMYCSTPNVICVAATGPTGTGENYLGPFVDVDAPAFYSNFGRSSIDVAAPGGNGGPTGWSFVFSLCPRTKMIVDEGIIYYSSCSFFPNNLYRSGYAGTSQAAPHVAGLVALLRAEGVTATDEIRARIQQSADDLGQPGVDPYYGKGRINAARAVGAM